MAGCWRATTRVAPTRDCSPLGIPLAPLRFAKGEIPRHARNDIWRARNDGDSGNDELFPLVGQGGCLAVVISWSSPRFFDAGLDPFRKPAAARVARPRARSSASRLREKRTGPPSIARLHPGSRCVLPLVATEGRRMPDSRDIDWPLDVGATRHLARVAAVAQLRRDQSLVRISLLTVPSSLSSESFSNAGRRHGSFPRRTSGSPPSLKAASSSFLFFAFTFRRFLPAALGPGWFPHPSARRCVVVNRRSLHLFMLHTLSAMSRAVNYDFKD